MATTSYKTDQLHDAFEVFSHQSGLLEASYRDLQDTVEALTLQLRNEQSARLRELTKQEKLSRHLSELLETMPGAILMLDTDGIVRRQNSEASALLHRPLIGCSWAEIISREAADGGSQDGNIELRDGRWLSLSRRSMASGGGEILLLADITESRRMADLRQRKERLEMIGEMTAEFAHQVRTPLATVMLYAGQLATATTGKTRIASKIMSGLRDLQRMVNDMLGYAAGARADEELVSVKNLLNEVCEDIRGQLSGATTLRVSVTDPTLSVAANVDAIKGAVLNLVANADQACPDGANILLHAHRFGDNIHLCVTDDGPGIPEDVRPHLFEAFFTTRPQGTGLGLAVVKAVAVAHSGDVTLSSSGFGTTFSMQLPAPAGGGAPL